jgi:tagatose 1,6-diphosphate aldolase
VFEIATGYRSTAAVSSPISVTRLLGLGLTPGKLRGLQRISNPNGTLTMVAFDQNSSMVEMLRKALKDKGDAREPRYDEIVEAKVELAASLAPKGSGVLLDSVFGAFNAVASFSIPRETGLLLRVEVSGGKKNAAGAPLGAYEAGWSVAKIKRMGADAVKLLAQFEPGEPNSAEHNFKFIQDVYEQCIEHDILMLLETIAFPFGKETKDDPAYKARKAETVIETARYVSRFCDVYKAEFPGHLPAADDKQHDAKMKELESNLATFNSVCERPWVLLSAGVDYPAFKTQVELAMKAGASGVLGGRAFWKEYFQQATPADRSKYVSTVCTGRVSEIDGIVKSQGTPWFKRYGLDPAQLARVRVAEDFHKRYDGPVSGGISSKFMAGETY